MAPGSTDPSTAPMEDVASAFLSLISPEEESTPSSETPGTSESTPDEEQPTSETDDSEQSEEEGSDAETDEDSEADNEAPQTFTVKIDGKEEQVTLDELLKGYSRTSDYTRKTQQVAEQRKQFETERARVTEVAQQYVERLKMVEEALKEATPTEPDWNKLRQESPEEFAATWAEFDQQRRRMETVRAEREQAEQLLQQEYQLKQSEYIASERAKLLEKIPEWKDPAKAKAEAAKLTSFAESLGFSADEVASISDHRPILLLRMAMQLHEARSKPVNAAKPAKARPAVLRPGTVNTGAGKKTGVTRAVERLAKSGSVDDAANFFLHTLED